MDPNDRVENLMRAAWAPARQLEPSEAEVARVLARIAAPTRRASRAPGRWEWRRLAAPGLAVLALAIGGMYAVPATRAAIVDVADTFTGWIGGGSVEGPGRPLGAGEDRPRYLYDDDFAHDSRVLAEAGGYKLFAYIGPSGGLNFDLGETGVGLGYEDTKEFEDHAVFLLGPGAMDNAGDPDHPARQLTDARGHIPLFGLAAKSVASVELTYPSGPPLRVDGVDGGFVLLAEPERSPREIVGFDAEGEVVGSQPLHLDWSEYVARP